MERREGEVPTHWANSRWVAPLSGDDPAYLLGDLFALALLVVLTADVGEPIDHRGHLRPSRLLRELAEASGVRRPRAGRDHREVVAPLEDAAVIDDPEQLGLGADHREGQVGVDTLEQQRDRGVEDRAGVRVGRCAHHPAQGDGRDRVGRVGLDEPRRAVLDRSDPIDAEQAAELGQGHEVGVVPERGDPDQVGQDTAVEGCLGVEAVPLEQAEEPVPLAIVGRGHPVRPGEHCGHDPVGAAPTRVGPGGRGEEGVQGAGVQRGRAGGPGGYDDGRVERGTGRRTGSGTVGSEGRGSGCGHGVRHRHRVPSSCLVRWASTATAFSLQDGTGTRTSRDFRISPRIFRDGMMLLSPAR